MDVPPRVVYHPPIRHEGCPKGMTFDSIWGAYRGPQHVIIARCDGMTEAIGFDPLGMPAREAFSSPVVLSRLDTVYRTGRADSLMVPVRGGREGLLVIVPLRDEGGVWGVTTLWKARQPVATPLASAPASPVALRESA